MASLQMTDQQIENLRRQAIDIISNARSTRRGHSTPWRKDLKSQIAFLILSTQKAKREILNLVKQELKNKWPDKASDIDNVKLKSLMDNIKSVTYEWLKQLQTNHPKASWYPQKAVPVAYRIFRFEDLDSNFSTLCNYLGQKARRPQLTSIPIPSSGTVLCFPHKVVTHTTLVFVLLTRHPTLFDGQMNLGLRVPTSRYMFGNMIREYEHVCGHDLHVVETICFFCLMKC